MRAQGSRSELLDHEVLFSFSKQTFDRMAHPFTASGLGPLLNLSHLGTTSSSVPFVLAFLPSPLVYLKSTKTSMITIPLQAIFVGDFPRKG